MTTYFLGFLAPLREFDRFVPEGFSLVPLEQRHLTLVYLGNRVRLGELREKLDALPPIQPFRVTFKGIAPFPSTTRVRYLAAVPDAEGARILQRLRAEAIGVLQANSDRYSVFRPHVSIAFTRLKPTLELFRKVSRAVRASRAANETLEFRELFLMEARAGEARPLLRLSFRG